MLLWSSHPESEIMKIQPAGSCSGGLDQEVTQRVPCRSRVIESDVCSLPCVPNPSSLRPNAVTSTTNPPSPTRHPADRSDGSQRHSAALTTQTGIHRGSSANGRGGRPRTCSSDQPWSGFRPNSEGRANNLSWTRPTRRVPSYGSRELSTCDGYSRLHL